jgi:PBP1b-binding outer membrane lipoprotein LpoB
MKKFVTFAALAGAALALSACGGKTEEAPAAEPTAEEMMAPVETPMADATAASDAMVDEAATAAEGQDPTGNPIGPGKSAPAAE